MHMRKPSILSSMASHHNSMANPNNSLASTHHLNSTPNNSNNQVAITHPKTKDSCHITKFQGTCHHRCNKATTQASSSLNIISNSPSR